jgi:hypothetical protein
MLCAAGALVGVLVGFQLCLDLDRAAARFLARQLARAEKGELMAREPWWFGVWRDLFIYWEALRR